MNHFQFIEKNKPATPCHSFHLTFGGRCLNCGYDPAEYKKTVPRVLTTQKQVREAFWQAWREGQFLDLTVTPRRISHYSGIGKMYNTDTRVAFCSFVDMLSKSGELSEGLADRVTL